MNEVSELSQIVKRDLWRNPREARAAMASKPPLEMEQANEVDELIPHRNILALSLAGPS